MHVILATYPAFHDRCDLLQDALGGDELLDLRGESGDGLGGAGGHGGGARDGGGAALPALRHPPRELVQVGHQVLAEVVWGVRSHVMSVKSPLPSVTYVRKGALKGCVAVMATLRGWVF